MMGNNRPAGTSPVYHLLHSASSLGTGPSTVHRLDLERLAGYLLAAVQAQLTPDQAEADIRAYLTAQGAAPGRIEQEVSRVRPLLQSRLGQAHSARQDHQ
jgi:hypothetical protein